MGARWSILAALLAFGSGALDVLALTHLGGVFASMMTGNLALMGFGIAHVDTAVLTTPVPLSLDTPWVSAWVPASQGYGHSDHRPCHTP